MGGFSKCVLSLSNAFYLSSVGFSHLKSISFRSIPLNGTAMQVTLGTNLRCTLHVPKNDPKLVLSEPKGALKIAFIGAESASYFPGRIMWARAHRQSSFLLHNAHLFILRVTPELRSWLRVTSTSPTCC